MKDPSGAAVANATVEISNPVSSFERSVVTAADGSFRITNVPFNPYHMTVTAEGFAAYTQDVEVTVDGADGRADRAETRDGGDQRDGGS